MIKWLFGGRTKLKIQSAYSHNDTVFTILHNEYQWFKVRNQHIAIETCCQLCGIDKELEVHHIRPWHLAPDLRYESSNLITLCRSCHYRFGHWLHWKRFNPKIKEFCKYTQEISREDRSNKGENDDQQIISGGGGNYIDDRMQAAVC